MAVKSILLLGTDEDVRMLDRQIGRGERTDLAVLDAFEKRGLPETAAVARTLFRRHESSELARTRAFLLWKKLDPQNAAAIDEEALEDPLARVRETAVSELRGRGAAPEAFEMLLRRLGDPDEDVLRQARWAVEGSFLARVAERSVFGPRLLDAIDAGQVEPWPKALYLIGIEVQRRGDRSRAATLFEWALRALEERPAASMDEELRHELTARLAVSEWQRGLREQAVARARILAQAGGHGMVCDLDPAQAVAEPMPHCGGRRDTASAGRRLLQLFGASD